MDHPTQIDGFHPFTAVSQPFAFTGALTIDSEPRAGSDDPSIYGADVRSDDSDRHRHDLRHRSA
ncbi:MAG: hypothetical protein AB8G26_17500 [Ilumatobacter sp.]